MCKCAGKIDGHLRKHNYMLSRNLLEGDKAPALVEIAKVDRKKRTPSMSMVANYCPFCGKKYPERKTRGVLKQNRTQHHDHKM